MKSKFNILYYLGIISTSFIVTCFFAQNALAIPSLSNPVLKTNAGGVYSETLTELDTLHFNYTYPPGAPVAPGDIYGQPGNSSLSPGSSAPKIADYTRIVPKGRTVIMTGSNFGHLHQLEVWVHGRTNLSNSTLVEATVIKAEDQVIAAKLPETLPGGMYTLWVVSDGIASAPVMLNRTEVWWASEYGQAGDTVSVYGSSLSEDGGILQSSVYLRPWGAGSGTPSVACQVMTVNPGKVDFKIPSGLIPDADYELWVHNGHGGDYGWSGPLKLRVESSPRYMWSGVFRNVNSYGAVPGDGNDDSAAVQAAIDAASDGDIIYFTAGDFNINSQVNCSKSLRIAGAHFSSVNLYSDGNVIFRFTGGGVELDNISFRASQPSKMIDINGYGVEPVPKGFFLSNCRFFMPKNNNIVCVEASWCGDVFISGCEFECSRGIFGTKPNNVRIENNDFNGNSATVLANAIVLWSSSNVDISGNQIRSKSRGNSEVFDRAIVFQSHRGVSYNHYIGENEMNGIAPTTSASINSGENILYEVGYSQYLLEPLSVSGTTLNFANQGWANDSLVTRDLSGWDPQTHASVVHIQDGQGQGQWRCIIANSSSSITIDRPWDVAPDTNSLIAIGNFHNRAVIYKNKIIGIDDENNNGIPDYNERNLALAGFETFGTCNELVISENEISKMRYGLYLFGRARNIDTANFYVVSLTNVTAFNNIIDNVQYGSVLTNFSTPSTSGSGDPGAGPTISNVVLRDNDVSNVAIDGVLIGRINPWYNWDWPFVQNVAVEHNSFDNAFYGVHFGEEQGGNIVINNNLDKVTYENDAAAFRFHQDGGFAHLFENSLANYASQIEGDVPWPVELGFQDGFAVGSAFISTENAGSAGGTATCQVFGSGDAQYTTGPSGGTDTAIRFIDGNGAGGVSAHGARLTLSMPAVSGDFSFATSFRLDGAQVVHDRVVEGAGVHISVIQAPRTVRITLGARYYDLSLADGQWAHVVVTYDHLASTTSGRGVGRWYVNGSAVTVTNQDSVLDSTFSASTLCIGSQTSTGNRPINGAVDDVFYYERVLSSIEVVELYNTSVGN